MSDIVEEAKKLLPEFSKVNIVVELLIEEITRLRAIIEQDNVEPVRYQRFNPLTKQWLEVNSEDMPHYILQGQEIRGLYLHPPKDSTEPASKDWVMVPRIATEEMINAAMEDIDYLDSEEGMVRSGIRKEWKAMIAAAPTTPKDEDHDN